MTNTIIINKEAVIAQLKMVFDPEIPVDIYELGLIYDIQIQEEGKINIVMTLTAPACPAAEIIPEDVKSKVGTIEGVSEVTIDLTFEPSWEKDMMSEEAKLELGML
jgi:FeS assembly SUF system protein